MVDTTQLFLGSSESIALFNCSRLQKISTIIGIATLTLIRFTLFLDYSTTTPSFLCILALWVPLEHHSSIIRGREVLQQCFNN